MADPNYPNYMPNNEVGKRYPNLPDYQNPELDVEAANETYVETKKREGAYTPALPSGRVDALKSTLQHDNLVGSIAGAVIRGEENSWFKEDPDFDILKYEVLFEGVDSDYYEYLTSAKSLEHAEFLSNKYKKATNDKAYLDTLGWEGVLYQTGSLIGDVPLLSVITKLGAAKKLGGVFYNMNKSYTGRAILTGTTEGAFEIAKDQFSARERTEMDLLFAVVGGGVLGGLYNPLKYDQQMQAVMKEALTETIDMKAAKKLPEESSWFREKINKAQFNITSRFEQSSSPTMNAIGDRLFLNVLKKNDGDFKGIEIRDQVADSIKSSFNKNFSSLYLDFMKETYGKGVLRSRFNLQAQNDFFQVAGDIFYGRSNPLIKSMKPEMVAKIENAFIKMSNESHDILTRAGHERFVSGAIKKTDDYMPLRWLTENIQLRKQAGDFRRKDFKALVRKSLESQMKKQGITLDKVRLDKAAAKFTATVMKKRKKSGKEAYISEEDAMRRAIDELGDMMDLTDAEIKLLGSEAAARKKTTPGLAASTKFRTPLDLDTKITLENGTVLSINEFVDTNIQSAWTRYGNNMGGDTALRSLGFDSRQSIQQQRDLIEAELASTGGKKKDLAIYDATMDHLLGRSSKTDPDGDTWRAARTANNLVRSASLGATWWSMAVEMARLTHANGVASMMKAIPAFTDVVQAYRGKNMSAAFEEIQLVTGLSGELNQMVSVARYEDTLGRASVETPVGFGAKLERFSDLAAEATALVGGVKTGTAFLEYMGAVAARAKMVKMARKGMTPKAYRYFEQFGFDKETTDQVVAQINKFASTDTGSRHPLLNLDKWDGDLGYKWSLGVRRRSHELVQRANFGDQNAIQLHDQLVGDTVMGSLAMNLKGYMMVAYNKQLSKGLTDISRGGHDTLDTLGNWGYQTVFASLAYTGKMYTTYGFDEDKLAEMLTPEMIAANTFSMTTFASFLPSAIDVVSEGVTDKRIFNSFGGRGSPAAAWDYANDIVGAGTTAVKVLSPFADASSAELNSALGTLPLSNAIGVNMLFKELSNALGSDR